MRYVMLLLALSATATAQAAPNENTRAIYLGLITQEAMLQGVPPALADAVAVVETGYRADAVGTSGEIGMMQILPATARQLGFTGAASGLFEPATNIRFGVRYLGRAWAMSGGNVCRALMKYRAGLGEEVMSSLSITYCARAMGWLDTTGSDLSRGAAPATAMAFHAPDLHAIAMLPPLPEQAGLLPAVQVPTPTYRRTLSVDAHVRRAVAAALSED